DRQQDGLRSTTAEDSRIARQEDGTAAEVLDAQAQLGERFPMFERAGRLVRRQLDRLGDQEPLDFQRAGPKALFQLLEEDPLVQRMLIDDQHAFPRLDDDVGVVKLDRFDTAVVRRPLSVVRWPGHWDWLSRRCRLARRDPGA